MKDVVIVGGGLAGLASAWQLRNRDILLLEADGRIGGRVRSERRGPYWLNWGGHVYAGGNRRPRGYSAIPVSRRYRYPVRWRVWR